MPIHPDLRDQLLTETREKDLLAEIGRLSLRLRAVEFQAHTLQAKLSGLEADGTIDQMGRRLPFPDHHKDCPHGQNGWAVCACEELKGWDARPIKTPKGKPLLPASEFSRMRIEDNKARGLSECNFLRQTGRTTAMVIEALEFLKKNTSNDVGVVIDVHNQRMKKHIKELFLHYADELGEVRHSWITRVTLRTLDEHCPQYAAAQLNLRDNALDDVAHNPVRDPRQDLKAGDHVRFEVRGVIASRQSGGIIEDQDGNDHELVQYAIKDFINGMTYYIGYDKIINVTWSREQTCQK